MNQANKKPQPYKRPMHAWWRRDPFFGRYMVREATAVAVGMYAIILMLSLVCLARGESAWEAWLAILQSPVCIVLHVIIFIALAIHAYTWFAIMPKTLPILRFRGRSVKASTIQWLGWLAIIFCTVILYGLAVRGI